MHTTHSKILTSILILIFLFSNNIKSQNTVFGGRVNIKFGSSLINSTSDEEQYTEIKPLLYSSIKYKFNKYIDAGIYVGYGNLMHNIDLPFNESTGMYEWYSIDSISHIRSNTNLGSARSKAVRYGLISEIHLLPFIFKKDLKFGIYLSPQIGFLSERYNVFDDYQRDIWSEPFFEYGLGIGTQYNFSKKFGIFSELTFGRFYHYDKVRFKLGLSFAI